MNWPSLSRHELPAELIRLYQRIPVKQLNLFCTLVLVLLLAWLAARLSWMLWPTETAAPVQAVSTANSASNESVTIEPLLAAHLFGQYQAKAEEPVARPAPNPTDAPKTSLNLKLTGVVATKNKPEQGTAIIESNGVEQVYGVDEQIEGTNASLKQVLEDRVLLQVSGRFETLMLDGLEYQQLSAENAAFNEGIQEVQAMPEPMEYGPAQQDIAAVRREMLAEPAKLFDYIRITPRHRNGQMYGYALTPGKDPELFARMGLMPNDVAIEINGVRLDDMQQAYGLINELREAKEASIKVERDGEIKDVLFSLSQ
ncbi:type II secretion system protein GspC [Rheinheimera sp. 4Y26]|uniref:type II secretion system protein GspC n=1 Tax=Rheinheimera sp. 4Y26 TaxID=2977811 RepID=UPI0021B0BF4A|nr:type II secretion system protein GspC [Rheinheimera sp. 4Y26]MCT6701292.1 type II secretion system protein GspC [Rheinheimera sp. 4Y26]